MMLSGQKVTHTLASPSFSPDPARVKGDVVIKQAQEISFKMNNNRGDSNQSWASESDDGQIGDLDEHHEKPYEVKIDEIRLSEKSDKPVW